MGFFKKLFSNDSTDFLNNSDTPTPTAPRTSTPQPTPSNAPTARRSISTNVDTASSKMIVEDVFYIKGRGIVATGTVASGSFSVEDVVAIIKSDNSKEPIPALITGIEAFHKKLDSTQAGENAGLVLDGIARDEIEKGDLILK